MFNVLKAALLVGGATILGAVIGYFCKYNNQKIDGAVFSFAAGIMLAAAFGDLVFPAVEGLEIVRFIIALCSFVFGGCCMYIFERLLTAVQKKLPEKISCVRDERSAAVIMFVSALALHNLPEGIAAGVCCSGAERGAAFTLLSGIALQNIPEGIVVIPPLVMIGMRRKKAFLISVFTGVIEIAGTFAGYYTAAFSDRIMPYILCATGGTMLYIISTDVLYEAVDLTGRKNTGFSFLAGVCMMLFLERFI